jgi:hypothetical protein
MTRHRHAQTGLVTPSPLDRWIDATLRVFAMLVLNVASTFQMKQLRPKRDWHTPDDEAALPRMKIDNLKEQHAVPQDSFLNSAHGEQRSSVARPSNHERVLTAPSPSIHAHPSLRSSRRKSEPRASRVMCVQTGLLTQPRIPACAGTSGDSVTSSNKTAPV